MGFHPDTGEELVPITKDVVALWKAQDTERKTEGARNPPQRIDPEQYAFFDPLTGKARVWYMRTASGEYQFYDNSGYHPETGEPLSIITKEVVDAWREFSSKPQAKRCYVITRDEHNPVRYGEQPGIDPVTGRQCRELTSEVVERLASTRRAIVRSGLKWRSRRSSICALVNRSSGTTKIRMATSNYSI
jgi:hypothetical protein